MENKYSKETLGKIGQIMNKIIKNLTEFDGMINYVKITEYTNELLDELLGKNRYELPIDIHDIVKRLGIEILELDLNQDDMSSDQYNRVVGELSIRPQIFGNGQIKCIYLDSHTTLYTQRYALAHELCHYLINEQKKLFTDNYCIMPMLPVEVEELLADAFAIALLIPINAFLKEFFKYIEEEKENGKLPISTEDWLQYLSTSSKVSYHYVACGYQQLRCVSLWMYQYREKLLKAASEQSENENLKKDLEKRKEEYPVLTAIVENDLTESIVEHLFQ